MTGAVRGTNTQALQILTNEPPPDIKRQTAQVNYWIRAHALKDNPTAKLLDSKQSHKLAKKNGIKKNKGTARDIAKTINKIDIKKEMITKIPIGVETLKWKKIDIDIRLNDKISKKETASATAKQITLAHIEDYYKDHDRWYTDGSLQYGLAGIGIYIEGSERGLSKRVEDHVAIVTAEMVAIKKAIEISKFNITKEKNKKTKIAIFTDSLSTLQALEGDQTKSARFDIITELNEKYTEAFNNNIEITLVWIPAHCDLNGNEEADHLARQGTQKRIIEKKEKVKLGTTELKALVKKRVRKLIWEKEWQAAQAGAKKTTT